MAAIQIKISTNMEEKGGKSIEQKRFFKIIIKPY
jgi:hypothetical protein